MTSTPVRRPSPKILQHREAGRQQREGPDKGGNPVRDLKGNEGHFEHAGDERDYRAHRPEKAAEKDRPGAEAFEEYLAALDHLRIARKRPDVMHGVFELQSDPVGDPVAERGPDRSADPDRNKRDVA